MVTLDQAATVPGKLNMNESAEEKPSKYPTTQWTQVIQVIQTGGDEESLKAVGELFHRYKPAIHAFFARFQPSQAEDLTAAFFESRVVLPWNRRHSFQSPLYEAGDLRRLEVFSVLLAERKRPVDDFLWKSLSEDARQMLRDGKSAELKSALVEDLNELLAGPALFEPGRFGDVKLSAESRNLLVKEPASKWGVWLNRSLLGDAFPRILTKGIGFLYMVERKEQKKFRTFLADSMWKFLKDRTDAETTQAAGGGRLPLSLDELKEEGFEAFVIDNEEMGVHLDLEFARQLVALASEGFKHSKQLEEHFYGRIDQKQAAEETGLSEGAFRQAYHRFRQRLAAAIRAEVAKLIGPNEEDIQAEIKYLMGLLIK